MLTLKKKVNGPVLLLEVLHVLCPMLKEYCVIKKKKNLPDTTSTANVKQLKAKTSKLYSSSLLISMTLDYLPEIFQGFRS